MTERSYISCVHDYDTDQILIWERPISGGERTMRAIPAPRYFYVPSENGQYTTITGDRVEKLVFETEDEFKYALSRQKYRFESDFRPAARALMDEYYDVPTPVVNYAFLDIEVDYSSKIGWSSPSNPYAPINAITIYKSWENKFCTYAVPPKGWKDDGTFQEQIAAAWKEHHLGFEPNVTICKDERELLLYMLDDIQDADIVSGWNSEFFDIPYIVKRIERVLGKKALAHLSFKGAKPPREKIVNRFGEPAITYQLFGRTHLDYLDLFKKFTFEGRVSYSLANITAEELDTPKLDYPGTLEELYKNDFVYFITYNAHDVGVLVQLDAKFKFMQLVNQMAHENTVPFEALLGTVRYVETGIANRAHNVHKLIVTDKRQILEENEKVEGAIVMTPRAGLWEWLGSVDITSLYPSVIRALNMSIETFVGQFKEGEAAWEGIRAKDDNFWTLVDDYDDAGVTMTGAEWSAWLKEQNFAISAFGTVFNQATPGMVADTLTYWFLERKRLQKEKKKWAKHVKEVESWANISNETDAYREFDIEETTEFWAAYKNETKSNIIDLSTPVGREKYLVFLKAKVEHYDLLQLTKKIQLNSTYGALLNEAFRFGRREIGGSVTGSGRQITKHMGQTIGEIITGKFTPFEKRYASVTSSSGNRSHVESFIFPELLRNGEYDKLRSYDTSPYVTMKFNKEKNKQEPEVAGAVWFTECPAIIYGDTDSCYFLTYGKDYDDAVAKADDIAAKTNASFPAFMAEAFNCTGGRELLIEAAREIVGDRGLFLTAKKKYTINVVNLEGADTRAKPKLKSMGSEIKKADTPKVIQDFLKELMGLVLSGKEYSVLEKFVNSSRGKLIQRSEDLIALGSAKQVNNLDAFYAAWTRSGKKMDGKVMMVKDGVASPTSVPGHVRASINYNELVSEYAPGQSKLLSAGDKVIVFYLKSNEYNMKSIAFPSDMERLPSWFTENFNIDLSVTETKMIDDKISGIFDALGEEVPTLQRSFLNSTFTF